MTDIAHQKTRLEELLKAITDELKTMGIHNPENTDDWVATPAPEEGGEADPNVVADRVEDWDERRATLSELEKQYNNIVRALKKIEEGAYGICEVSGEAIEEDRLNANPAARTCKQHLDAEASLTT